jgi:hypothetical protein
MASRVADRALHHLGVVADQCGQEAGGAEPPMRAADRGDRFHEVSLLNSTPPPPLTCTSMKPGSSQPPIAGR